MAFRGGLSFNLDDVIVPDDKERLVKKDMSRLMRYYGNYNMGFITNNERYNQVIDIWTHTMPNLPSCC
jgi:DNA-directed RNA polymerase subunit beta'